MDRTKLGAILLAPFMTCLAGCGQLLGAPIMAAYGGIYVDVTNASSVPVCSVNMWRDGAAANESTPEHNWLDTGPIRPGETRKLAMKKNGQPYHFRAQACSGGVLTEVAALDVSASTSVMVH